MHARGKTLLMFDFTSLMNKGVVDSALRPRFYSNLQLANLRSVTSTKSLISLALNILIGKMTEKELDQCFPTYGYIDYW